MATKTISSGVVHNVPKDLRDLLSAKSVILELWNGLTPLARNEWICWLTFVKKAETRRDHLKRLGEDLKAGKRRPCCWPGCPHRRPSAAKYFPGFEKKV
jgi:uncharacterized protein YdeI (YjbR/CyaY-like superfamily)